MKECGNLQLDGLMTIGRFGYNPEDGPNPDFLCLKSCRDEICQNLGLDWKNINLSMGMSDDFEHAVSLFLCLRFYSLSRLYFLDRTG